MAQRKFYVVWVGREPGIYDNWDDCEQQVAMFPGARYKAFTSQTAATLAFRGSPDDQEAIVRAIADHNAATPPPGAVGLEELKERFPEINGNAIAVDGACSGNPGPMEYQGVDLRTGERLFHFGPLDGGTNNAAEYLALVHALALLYIRLAHSPLVDPQQRAPLPPGAFCGQCPPLRAPRPRRPLGADPSDLQPHPGVGYRPVGGKSCRFQQKIALFGRITRKTVGASSNIL